MNGPSRAVYTVLTGGYEALNEQPIAPQSEVPFICFTDDPGLVSETWDVHVVEPRYPSDPARSSRDIKVRGHAALEGFEETLYIDNSVVLREPPESILAEWLADADLAMPLHSYRATVADEFEAVLEAGLDDPTRVYEQARHYLAEDPSLLEAPVIWGALIARRRAAAVADFETDWFEQLLRYSRRDQLSVQVALRRSGVRFRAIELDNMRSAIHRWPIAPGRDRSRRGLRPQDWQRPLGLEVQRLQRSEEEQLRTIRLLEADLGASLEQSGGLLHSINIRSAQLAEARDQLRLLEAQVDDLTSELQEMRQSRSWQLALRLSRPVAWIRGLIRR